MARRLLAAALAGLIGFLAVVACAGTVGVTWDEAIYMRSARRYVAWLSLLRQSLTRGDAGAALRGEAIQEYWSVPIREMDATPSDRAGVEDIHPPLIKLAGGLSWRLLGSSVGELLAFRLVSGVLFGLLLAVLFAWTHEVYGRLAAVAAVLALALMPRFFLQTNLLALDMPLASFSVLATYIYWKTAARPGLIWAVPFGAVWGLAMATKNGGWLLPVGIIIWALLHDRRRLLMLRLSLALPIAAALFVVLWPWLYHDTLHRLAVFFRFAFLGHADLLQQHTYYLGRVHETPPWHYPVVMMGAVVPAGLLVMAVMGIASVVRDEQATSTGWLLVLSTVGPMLPFLLGLVAAYDGERLFLSSFPFMAVLAGRGFLRTRDGLWRLLWRWRPRLTARRDSTVLHSLLTVALAGGVFVPPATSIARVHPYELAYYSELVGGIQGAARLGFETTFWADGYQGTLEYINASASAGATVWADAYQVLWAYQDLGRLRKDIFVPGSDPRDPGVGALAIVQARQSRYFPAIAELVSRHEPAFSVRVQGIPLVMVYRTR